MKFFEGTNEKKRLKGLQGFLTWASVINNGKMKKKTHRGGLGVLKLPGLGTSSRL